MESVWPAQEDVDLSDEVESHLADLRSIREEAQEVMEELKALRLETIRHGIG
jgi:regulator of replication initiation timing